MSKIELYKGDCLELMKNIPDKSVDMVLTDPPYEFKQERMGGGRSELSNRTFKKELSSPLLNQKFDEKVLMQEIERVCKKVNCIIFGTDPMMQKLMSYAENKGYYYNLLIWHKTNPPPFTNNNYLKDIELAIMIREKGCPMFGDYHTLSKVYSSIINQKDKALYNHPTIKPVELIEKYIINHTRENDTVLDCYMGSGTTGVACIKTNRNFIGIELDDNYFNIASERIKQAEIEKKSSLF